MNRLTAFFFAAGLLLAGCGSVPPAPIDRFYRLQPVAVSSVAKPLSGAVVVQTFRADSLYAERPVIYSDAAGTRQLRQYHYHLWLYPPAQLVREHLVSSVGSTLDLRGGLSAPNVLDGRLVDFERVVSGKRSKAVVALELHLQAGGKTLLSKIYRAEQPAGDESMEAFVVAMEQALGKVYGEFLTDLTKNR
jgi:ABC-type uncharacterized transport system auxiliary subunit